MANTATLVTATPYRLVYLLTGDGTVSGPTIANADLLGDAVPGPLYDILSADYENQDAMRAALLVSDPVRIRVALRGTPVQTTAEQNLVTVDVDVDAVTATKPEVNVSMSDTTGQVAYLEIEYLHPIIR